MYLTLIQMTLKTLLNIIQANFLTQCSLCNWLLKIRCIIQLDWKRKTKEFINPTQGQLGCEWTSHERLMHVQITVCVYWVMRALFLYGSREGRKLQSLIKPLHQATSNRIERGQLGFFPLHFLKLKLYIVLKLNLIIQRYTVQRRKFSPLMNCGV